MGKWGGYHTDFRHLSRGFAGNDRALADEVGEALLEAGLLEEKPSVGQRHVYLNSRRAADIHGLIERGAVPPGPAPAVSAVVDTLSTKAFTARVLVRTGMLRPMGPGSRGTVRRCGAGGRPSPPATTWRRSATRRASRSSTSAAR